MERNYPMTVKLFDYNAYNDLLTAIGNAEKSGDADAQLDLQSVQKAFQSFHDYVSNVDMTETQIKLAQARYDGSDFRDAVQRYDAVRRAYHEGAIANCSLVNNMAKVYGVSKIFLGTTADRLEVADFCLDCTVQIFENRRK